MHLEKPEIAEVIPSLQKFCQEELEVELSDLRARFLLDYFMKEVAPFAYNRGVKDAETYLRARVEDLSGVCYESPMGYWPTRRKG